MALRLHWPDERYVRIYCRDTLDWQSLSWDAQALYVHLCRKASRRGTIDLGRVGRKGVAALAGRPGMDLLGALDELEADGCVHIEGTLLAISEFVEAQEAVSSGKARTQRWREGQRTPGEEMITCTDEPPSGDETSQEVTSGYSTAGHGTEGTARPARNGAALPAQEPAGSGPEGGPKPRATREDDHATQVAALNAEAYREDKRLGRVLTALGSAWRTSYDLAQDLGRKADGVHSDLAALRRRGQVESAECGAPPVTHWRRTAGDSP